MKFLVLLMLVAAAVTDSQPPKFPNAEGGIIEVPNHNFDSLFHSRPNPPQVFLFNTTKKGHFVFTITGDTINKDNTTFETKVQNQLFGGNANTDKNANVFRIVNMAGVVTAPASEDPVSMETIDPKPQVDKADTGIPATESNGNPN